MKYQPEQHGARCDQCPRKSSQLVPPEGHPGARWAWVGQDPGKQELKAGRPFSGSAGTRMQHIWQAATGKARVNVTRQEVWLTNAVLCAPVTNKEKESREATACCRPRLLNELRQLDPDAAVLLMGKLALLSVTGELTGGAGLMGFGMDIDLKRMQQLTEEK